MLIVLENKIYKKHIIQLTLSMVNVLLINSDEPCQTNMCTMLSFKTQNIGDPFLIESDKRTQLDKRNLVY